MQAQDLSQDLQQQVKAAYEQQTALQIIGGNSKSWFGCTPQGEPLHLGTHQGVVNYEPTELVITARAGTCLQDIENLTQDNQQMLPFEPPYFADSATLGGVIACGLSGPRRPYAGAARDLVLGMKILNGRGEILHFGGEVMKNVAGYDVSRLMVGALGTLGILLEISLKVLPLPAREITLVQECDAATAITRMNQWAARPLPLSATCHVDGKLYVRLSGATSAVKDTQTKLGGEVLNNDTHFWQQVRELTHVFFQANQPLWRFSVPSTTPAFSQTCIIDWGGSQRWLHAPVEDMAKLRQQAEQAGGHVQLFRGEQTQTLEVFHPVSKGIMRLQHGLKQAFDPKGILNPGRM